MGKEYDWSDAVRLYHDFNDDDSIALWEGMVVWAGNGEGGMKVRLGRAHVNERGLVTFPFEQLRETWKERED